MKHQPRITLWRHSIDVIPSEVEESRADVDCLLPQIALRSIDECS